MGIQTGLSFSGGTCYDFGSNRPLLSAITMKFLLPPLAALITLTMPVSAAYLIFPDGDTGIRGDTKAAHEAYKRGEFAEAVRMFKAEAARGDKDAQFAMGRLYEEGRSVEASPAMAENWYRKASQQGHPSAQFNLAMLLLGTQGRAAEGIEWIRKAADAGSARAMLALGTMAITGAGIEKNPAEAKKWLEKAAGAGEPEGYDTLGQMYEAGQGTEKNAVKAVEMYESAAKRDFIKSMLRLGLMYLNGLGVEKNGPKAVEWFHRAAEKGSLDAMRALGQMYETGSGVERSAAEAVTWYQKAAEAGDPAGSTRLGDLYAEGTGVAQDEKKAMEWYLKAAEKGGAGAMYAISVLYDKGRGVTASPQDAVKWSVKAALNGLPLAQREMGKRYRSGRDVNKDTIVAQSWFTRATLSGDAESALTVSDMLITGEGGLPPDPKTAKSILTRAAELGMVEAQLKLAGYYEKGLDGRPDLIRAYALALATGDYEGGKKMREALEKKMTKEQIEQGKKEYDRLKTAPPPAKADEKPAAAAPGAEAKKNP